MKFNKKAFEMSFNWLFAVIAGAFILFLAIYGTVKLIGTGQQVVYTETSAKLVAFLDSAEAGLAYGGKPAEINFKRQTRTYYTCNEKENLPFGKQTISFSEQSLGDKWGDKGGEITTLNKYVFAEDIVQGKTLNIFSKQFSAGFRVADLIIISSDNYCFYPSSQIPNEIKDEIQGLNIKNIFFSDSLSNCTGTRVCFGVSGCNITVYDSCGSECDYPYEHGSVKKQNKNLYYSQSLLYAAIFSSQEIYECNLKRLMSRFNELSEVYIGKIRVIEKNGCSSNIESDLQALRAQTTSFSSSSDLFNLNYFDKINSINMQNSVASCKLY
jgi:hypothetical protein